MNVIIKSNGEVIPTNPKNGTDFQLEELQAIVCGLVQIIHLHDEKNHLMLVNEEGKNKKLPFNSKATYLYINHTSWKDAIVGDVLVCENNMIK